MGRCGLTNIFISCALLMGCVASASAVDLSSYKQECIAIGHIVKTEQFGDCVLELKREADLADLSAAEIKTSISAFFGFLWSFVCFSSSHRC